MIILRQKEFGNKANKIKTRQWQMTQAVNPVIQHQSMGGIPQEHIIKIVFFLIVKQERECGRKIKEEINPLFE